ncbi:ATP-binding protein [Arenimonas caeni]|nr:ATP-binding protein [Arenimonas caeni]
MSEDSWLPPGYQTPKLSVVRKRVASGDDWQIFDCGASGRALLVESRTAQSWVTSRLMPEGEIAFVEVAGRCWGLVEGGHGCRVESLCMPSAPTDLSDVEAFAAALQSSLKIDPSLDTSDAIYIERLSRVLPTTAIGENVPLDRLVGMYLTGGVDVSILAPRRVLCLAPWMTVSDIEVVKSRLQLEAIDNLGLHDESGAGREVSDGVPQAEFSLPGRPQLQAFINENVVDIVRNADRYERLGVGFPGAILLHGPPGSGKTYAVERLVDFLGWPCLSVDCGSIGSPYIHETGRKIAAMFDEAAEAAPSVLLIDEIDAFLSARDEGAGGQHRVEEVAEFLRRIPEAAKSKVLVVGMTNRLTALDPAVVRRGRFDHILEVGMPSEVEVKSALEFLIGKIPTDSAVDISRLASSLCGRPMSDVAFVVKDACRRAARRGSDRVCNEDLVSAMTSAGARTEEVKKRKIGFI